MKEQHLNRFAGCQKRQTDQFQINVKDKITNGLKFLKAIFN